MTDYLLLMLDDLPAGADDTGWVPYIARLKQAGVFEGGSAVGGGVCVRKRGPAPPLTAQIVGYIRVTAADIDGARSLLAGNPHYDAGGTVEIRELPRTG